MLVLSVAGVAVLYRSEIAGIFDSIRSVRTELATPLEKTFSLPPPLRSQGSASDALLTPNGVIAETNRQRILYGVAELSENEILNAAALTKAKDILARQYFAHESPTGQNVQELVEGAGYEFLAVGENLALGNYEDDMVLVQAWMASPGHRENILSPLFSEIGVGVVRGTFEGETTWVAVQEFAKPSSACVWPDVSLKESIDGNVQELDRQEQELALRKQELDRMRAQHDPQYNQKAEEYNVLVAQYNQLFEHTQAMIAQYNMEVTEFNRCVSG